MSMLPAHIWTWSHHTPGMPRPDRDWHLLVLVVSVALAIMTVVQWWTVSRMLDGSYFEVSGQAVSSGVEALPNTDALLMQYDNRAAEGVRLEGAAPYQDPAE